MKKRIKQFGRSFLKILSHNIHLKLLSVLIAILLWNFVISEDNSITRTKTISSLTANTLNESVLTSNGLALPDDIDEQLTNLSVIVEVSQANYSYVSSDNIQLYLDLSNVRSRGTQEVSFTASSSYGRVLEIIPDSITLDFEPLDSRSVPVNVELLNGEEGYWYSVAGRNPSTLTVSGASSRVQSIASAYVTIDESGQTSSHTVSREYTLRNSSGEEVSQANLSRTSSSVTVNVEVFPTKELSISTNPESILVGTPAEGYYVESVTVQPGKVTVAGEPDLLATLSELLISPISVEGVSHSFYTIAEITSLSNLEYVSADEVYAYISIAEESETATFDKLELNLVNVAENFTAIWERKAESITVTGPRSYVEKLVQSGLTITVDLEGYGAGTHVLELPLEVPDNDDVSFTPNTIDVTINLTENSD